MSILNFYVIFFTKKLPYLIYQLWRIRYWDLENYINFYIFLPMILKYWEGCIQDPLIKIIWRFFFFLEINRIFWYIFLFLRQKKTQANLCKLKLFSWNLLVLKNSISLGAFCSVICFFLFFSLYLCS